MQNISLGDSRINPQERDVVADAAAYIDTLTLLMRYPVKGLLKALQRELGTRRAWFDPCFDKGGQQRGVVLIVHQPSIAVLSALATAQRDHGAILSRVDVAFDFDPRPGFDADHVTGLLHNNAVLKWRPTGPMHEIEETTYWVEQSSRKRRSGRDIALYADRPSKLTGELDTIHLEIRLQTARSVKANGIHTVDDLLTLDPRVLFERNISIVEFDEAQARKDFIRRNARLERRKHQVSTTAFIDQYRASIPRRLKQIWKRSQCDRVQVYAQHYSIRRMKRLHVFSLPSGLRWGAMKSLGNSGGVQVL